VWWTEEASSWEKRIAAAGGVTLVSVGLDRDLTVRRIALGILKSGFTQARLTMGMQ